jgi:hypothetical protein
MKLKGISPLEQNVDRIVLGVVGLVCLGAIGLQFMPEKPVKVGNPPKETRATEAMSIVEAEAKVIAARLDSTTIQPPEVPSFSLADKLAVGASAPRVATNAPRVPLGSAPALTGIAAVVRQADDLFALPAVPAPTGGLAHVVQATINPAEKIRHPELGKLLPEAQPFDKAAVSVEFSFNGAALRESLTTDPDGDGPLRPIPLNWWRDQGGGASIDLVEIVAVQYERETITNADGVTPETPEVVIVPAPPGRAYKLDEWKQLVRSAGDVAQVMLPAVQDVADEIQRPPYYSIVAGPEWQPPSKAVTAGDAAAKLVQINNLNRRLAEVTRRIEDLEERLAQVPAGGREEARQPEQAPTRARGGGRQAPAPSPRETTPTPTGDRATIEAQLRRQRAEWENIARQLTELGETVPGYEGATAATQQDSETPSLPLLENSDVRVWTHDLTVEPGATYRYRARVIINNPLYGRNLQQSQSALAAESLIEGPWSDWTAPITVDRPSYFFFTSATEANPPLSSQPMASAEMYVFNYGYYRLARVQLTPGDILYGTAKMPPSLKYADMEKLAAMVEHPEDETPRPTEDIAPQPAGRAPMPQPGGKGGSVGAPGTQAARPEPAAPTQAATPEALDPAWSIDVPDNLEMTVDVTFLDASAMPGTQRNDLGGEQVLYQVVLRDQAGRIVVRYPAVDRASDVYKRVSESAKAGETQGEVRKVVLPERRQPPRREREPLTPRAPRAPRSGGGGGGG